MRALMQQAPTKGDAFMRMGLVDTAMLLLVASLAGCSTPLNCEAPRKCGGNFLAAAKDLGGGIAAQEWVATATDACIDNVPTPPNPASLTLIPPRPAGIRAVEPATVDWCNNLVMKSDGTIKDYDDGWYYALKQFGGWFPSVPLHTAQLELQENFQYTLTTTQLVRNHVNLSQSCLIAQGLKVSCDHLNRQLKDFLQKKFNTVTGLNAEIYGNACVPMSDDSCSCDYNVSLISTTAGPWAADDEGRISFFDFTAAPPVRADFCSSTSSLSLAGTDGDDLFNRGALKTLSLKAPTCSDRVMSKTLGETGIDCGGSCPPCE
jgi:hypothetical protein